MMPARVRHGRARPRRAGSSPDGDIAFRATGSVLVSPGFIAVYQEGLDDTVQDEQDRILPAVAEGDRLALKDLQSAQHFTEPPPRYSEATLVKALEEFGIGRPSTYASIISTLRNREYVEMENRRFIPTDVGRVVNRFLTEYFSQYVDYEFTARMEDSLDAISRGEREWVPLLEEFWRPFSELVEHTESSRHARAGLAGASARHGSRERAADERADGPLRRVRADRHEGRRREAEVRGPAARPEDGHASRSKPRSICSSCRASSATTPEGEPVAANIGRFGPYVRYGSKFVSIRGDDPYTITLERALELIAEKKIADANRLIRDFPEAGIQVLNGRYGPYVTNKKKNAKIPKDRTPAELTLEECEALLAAAPERRARGMRRARRPPGRHASSRRQQPEAAASKRKKKTKKKARAQETYGRARSAAELAPRPRTARDGDARRLTSRLTIARAARIVLAGGVIAYPTEAVFGLGCLPQNRAAVERVLALKRRSWRKGLLLIGADLAQLERFVVLPPEPQLSEVLATWPGPGHVGADSATPSRRLGSAADATASPCGSRLTRSRARSARASARRSSRRART